MNIRIQRISKSLCTLCLVCVLLASCSVSVPRDEYQQHRSFVRYQNKYGCELLVKVYRSNRRTSNRRTKKLYPTSVIHDVAGWFNKGRNKHLAHHLINMKCPENLDLRWIQLQNMDLRKAYIRGAMIHLGNLDGAILRKADLRDSKFPRATFKKADLRWTQLQRAYIVQAELQGANLRFASLKRADLRFAEMQKADLRKADLRFSLLSRTDLRQADLRNADLRGAVLMEHFGTFDITGARLDGVLLQKSFLSVLSVPDLRQAHASLSDSQSICLPHKFFPKSKSPAWRCYLWHNVPQKREDVPPMGCPKILKGAIIVYHKEAYSKLTASQRLKLKKGICPISAKR